MKKTLKMKFEDKTIEILEEEKPLITIQRSDMKLDGYEIYEKILKPLPPNEMVEIVVEYPGPISKDDRHIFDRFERLMSQIANSINESQIAKTQEE